MGFLQSILQLFSGNRGAADTPPQGDSSKEKGDAFEKYIIKKFDRKFFTLKDMRSDKGAEGSLCVRLVVVSCRMAETRGQRSTRWQDTAKSSSKWS